MSKGRVSREILTKFLNKTVLNPNNVNTFNSKTIEICGSYRRGLFECGDLDIILVGTNIAKFTDLLMELENDYSFNINRGGNKYISLLVTDTIDDISFNLDLKVVPDSSRHTATLHYTGSQFLNIAMRSIAKKNGFALNEYGLVLPGTDVYTEISSEEEIFNLLGYEYIEPELRSCVDIPSAFSLLKQFKK